MGRKKKGGTVVVVDKKKDNTEIANIRPTKADLFVDAFIRHRFNATQAALEVFDINGDENQQKRTAGSIGHEYLMKPEVQKILQKRMERADLSVEWVLTKIKSIADKTQNEDIALRAIDRVAHFVGAEIKERSTDVSRARNPQLALYMGMPFEQKAPPIVVDAQSTKG